MKYIMTIMAALVTATVANAAPILWDIGKSSSADNTPSTVAEFIAAGVTENLTGATVSNVDAAQNMTSGAISVDMSAGPNSHAAGFTYTGAGSSIIKDYAYFRDLGTGVITNTISGLSAELDPNTQYSLYIWGKGDAAAQFSTFTYDGTPISVSNADPLTTDAENFAAKYSFTTDAVVADTLEFEWTANNKYTAFNGFAIAAVPEPATLGFLGLSGLGLMVARRFHAK